jgi:hypothetical protein
VAIPKIRADGNVHGVGPAVDKDRSDFTVGETVSFVDTEVLNVAATHAWVILEAPTGSSNALGTPTVFTSTLVLDAIGTWIIQDTVGLDVQTIRIAVRHLKTGIRTPAFGEKGQWDEGSLTEGWHPAREEADRNFNSLIQPYDKNRVSVNESHNSATPLVVGQFQFNPNEYNADATKLEIRFRATAINGNPGLTTHCRLYNLTDSEIVATLNFTSNTVITTVSALLTVGAGVGDIKQANKLYEVLIYVDAPAVPGDSIELGSAELEVRTKI